MSDTSIKQRKNVKCKMARIKRLQATCKLTHVLCKLGITSAYDVDLLYRSRIFNIAVSSSELLDYVVLDL